MFRKLVQHKIVGFRGRFFCCLCLCEIQTINDALHHTEKKKHLELLTAAFSVKDYVAKTRKILPSDNTSICIRFAFICVACKKIVAALEDISQHVRSATHHERLSDTLISRDEIYGALQEVTDDNSQGIFYDLDSLYRDLHPSRKDNFNKLLEAYETKHEFSSSACETMVCNRVIVCEYCQLICDICGRSFREPKDILQHMKAKAHNIFESKNDGQEEEEGEFEEEEEEGEFEEEEEEDEFEEEDEDGFQIIGEYEDGLEDEGEYEDDLEDEEEYEDEGEYEDLDDLEDEEEYEEEEEWEVEDGYEEDNDDDADDEKEDKEKEKPSQLRCELCNCGLPSQYHEVQHFLGKRHNKKLESLLAGKDSNENLLSNLNAKITNKEEQINSDEMQRTANVDSDSSAGISKGIREKLLQNGVTIHGPTKFSCTLCNRRIDTLHNIENHIKGWTHKDALKSHKSKSSASKNDTDVTRIPVADFTDSLENAKCSLSSKPLVPLAATTSQSTSTSTVSSSEKGIDEATREKLLKNGVTIHGSNKFSCTICDRRMLSLHNIQFHIKGSSHCTLKSRKSKSSVAKTEISGSIGGIDIATGDKLLQNGVTIHGPNKFFCTICKRYLDSLCNSEAHIKGKSHRNILESRKLKASVTKIDTNVTRIPVVDLANSLEIANDERSLSDKPLGPSSAPTSQSTSIPTVSGSEESIDKAFREKLLNNEVAIHGPDQFSCSICDRRMLSAHDIRSHVEGKCHRCALKDRNSSSGVSECTADVNSIPIIDLTDSLEDVREPFSLSSNPFTSTSASTDSEEDIVSTIPTCYLDDPPEDESKKVSEPDNRYRCTLCNVQIDVDNFVGHFDSSSHKCNIRFTSMGDDIVLYKCFSCRSITQGSVSFIDHLLSSSHSSNVTNYLKRLDPATFGREKYLPYFAVLIPEVGEARTARFYEEPIVSIDVSSIKSFQSTKCNVRYYCLRCRITVSADQDLLSHCQGKMHLWKIRQLFAKDGKPRSDKVVALTNQLNGLSIRDEARDQAQDVLSTLPIITLGINKEITRELRRPLHSPKKPAPDEKPREKSLGERLNKIYDKQCLDIEVEIYNVEKKLICIKRNFKSIVPQLKDFYCIACKETVSREFHLLYEHVCCKSHRMQIEIIGKDPESNGLLREYMRQGSKDKIKCYPCKQQFKSDQDAVKHTSMATHKKNLATLLKTMDEEFRSISQELNDNLWYSIQRYACVPCKANFKYKMEFVKHVGEKHAERSTHSINFCIPCTALWLESEDSYTEHCRDVTHRYLIKNRDFMIEDLPESMKTILTQADEISDLLFRQTEVLLNDNIQKEVTRSLENILKPKFPQVKAFAFGSRVTGLSFANSDIDIYLDCDNTYYESNSEDVTKNRLKAIKEILRKQDREWEVKALLEETRIPIIKLVYKRTGIHCDISIVNGLSVENSKLIRSFNDAYLPCRKLILFVKKWFSHFDLPGRHGLTNYALAWFVIFYLQSESYLPSVAELIKQENQSRFISGWQIGVAKPKDNNKSARPVSTLLAGFFEFYANFNYRYHVVCPLMGKPILKRAFVESILPLEMKPYVNHLKSSKDVVYFFRVDSPLCVQDPFDLSHNLTKAVTSITLRCFRRYCRDSATILKSLRVDS